MKGAKGKGAAKKDTLKPVDDKLRSLLITVDQLMDKHFGCFG